ncbi:hypothetical protein K2173_009692 [Erythroxylum novogranatense]|uniref:Uncharacterized protein n=1 Tax=Erythroxylum novogranatense TaxID=1862640 RepID=A0AAV8U4P8_9ROSI|nr:hypothetical protein K2173_009692 [Erythroxylum novogranatense]
MKSITDDFLCAGVEISVEESMQHILTGLRLEYLPAATLITGTKLDLDDSYSLLLSYEARLKGFEQGGLGRMTVGANFAQVSKGNKKGQFDGATNAKIGVNPKTGLNHVRDLFHQHVLSGANRLPNIRRT